MCLRSPQLSRKGAESQVPALWELDRGAIRKDSQGRVSATDRNS